MDNVNIITLLNDGETFTSVEGSAVCVVDDANLALLQGGALLSEYLEWYDLNNPRDLRLLADRIEQSR